MQTAVLQGELSSQGTVTLGLLFPSLGWVSGFPKNRERCFSLLRTRNMGSITRLHLLTEQSCLPDTGLEPTALSPRRRMEPLYGEPAALLPAQPLSLVLLCLHNFLTRFGHPTILGDFALRLLMSLEKNCDKSIVQFSYLVFSLFLEWAPCRH